MQISDVVDRWGGLATRAQLIAATSRADVDRALRSGDLVRAGRGRYSLPATAAAAQTAFGMHGVLSHTSAALHHGWQVKSVPERPHVLVPRHRRVPDHLARHATLHYGDLTADEISGGVATSRELTLLHCLRSLPDDEALAIADSALRNGEQTTLRRAAASARGAGSAKVRRLAAAARGEPANPFESVTRAIASTVEGLSLEPQVVISSDHVWAQPDLVDVHLRGVVECESFEFHSKRESLRKDVRRYSLLVADGWWVLRFIWEDVMHRPEWVHEVMTRAVARALALAEPHSAPRLAA
ncbi:hypothetical protein K8W59_07145 [Nocardioides rotundus]|uniref:type IV toxin-antitoxin system AbiEi family antitoxin domain-containing protein n=1 Tax=Nocardioides rotundus TaxID=1774216 RepID=UPI001CBC7293|nr:type IV toxin-antitoxin system AbiEi family antitoxin domain-containing protein [Nocardioides rotundus]UAL31231.1 hypothetical protein K8W59_07145 [Nocardioides rotundus]